MWRYQRNKTSSNKALYIWTTTYLLYRFKTDSKKKLLYHHINFRSTHHVNPMYRHLFLPQRRDLVLLFSNQQSSPSRNDNSVVLADKLSPMRFQIIVLTDYMNVSHGELNFISLQLMRIHFYFIRIKQNL